MALRPPLRFGGSGGRGVTLAERFRAGDFFAVFLGADFFFGAATVKTKSGVKLVAVSGGKSHGSPVSWEGPEFLLRNRSITLKELINTYSTTADVTTLAEVRWAEPRS
jgi:hypothetical protein